MSHGLCQLLDDGLDFIVIRIPAEAESDRSQSYSLWDTHGTQHRAELVTSYVASGSRRCGDSI